MPFSQQCATRGGLIKSGLLRRSGEASHGLGVLLFGLERDWREEEGETDLCTCVCVCVVSGPEIVEKWTLTRKIACGETTTTTGKKKDKRRKYPRWQM